MVSSMIDRVAGRCTGQLRGTISVKCDSAKPLLVRNVAACQATLNRRKALAASALQPQAMVTSGSRESGIWHLALGKIGAGRVLPSAAKKDADLGFVRGNRVAAGSFNV